jgi:pimeloyl-ACP methyl ester carboxylesterase
LPELAAPTLLIAGALDTKFCAINRAMQREIPGAALTVVPDAGHTVHAEQPESFRRAILDFLP